jgi:hypothetical protein
MPKQVHFAPELIELQGRSWDVEEVEIIQASVDLVHAKARVPQARTPAQKLARKHEGGHVKYSPRPGRKHGDWPSSIARVMEKVGPTADYDACVKLSKMLEENRIDWLLWDRHKTDLRPAREVLDWGQMPDPDTLLQATGIVLQLAWTVWASRGLSKGIPNEPPARTPDADTGEYFDKAWKMVCDENEELAFAAIKGCLRMYANPTHTTRELVAAELATYFPKVEEEEPQPKEKPEEKKAQEEAEQEEKEAEDRAEQEATGAGSEIVAIGRVQYHDHTATVRQQNARIIRRSVPVAQGINARFAHRWMLDKSIFAQRMLTEGGVMIDGSGSMKWTDDDMKLLLDKLPAVTVGLYSGAYGTNPQTKEKIYGRICTIAKNGKFAKFTGRDPGTSVGNEVDYEALQMLAKWPEPRLWLSDGIVCGGVHHGPCDHSTHLIGRFWYEGKLHEMCSAWMKAHRILRVPDRDTMLKLLRRQRVTLYRTPRPADGVTDYGDPAQWPPHYRPEPVQFQL